MILITTKINNTSHIVTLSSPEPSHMVLLLAQPFPHITDERIKDPRGDTNGLATQLEVSGSHLALEVKVSPGSMRNGRCKVGGSLSPGTGWSLLPP
jgi:hypothetical protein